MSDSRRSSSGLTTHAPVVLITAPVLFVVFGFFLPVALAVGFSPFFQLATCLLLAFTAGTVYGVESRLVRSRTSGAAAQIREFVSVVVGSGLILWAFLQRPVIRATSSPEFWIALVSVVVVWALTGLFRRLLARHDFFVAAILRAVHTSRTRYPESEAVAAATRNFASEAGDAVAATARARRLLGLFLIWLVGVLVVRAWVLGRADAVEEIGICVSAVVIIYGILQIGKMREEHRFLTHGIIPSPEGSNMKSALSSLLFIFLVLASFLLSMHRAVITRTMLTMFLQWIAALLSRLPSTPKTVHLPPPPVQTTYRPRPEFLDHIANLPSGHGSDIVGTILVYLGWSLVAIVAAAFLWMLVSPLFRLRFRRQALRRAGRMAFDALRRGIGSFIRRSFGLLAALAGMTRNTEGGVGAPSGARTQQRRIRRRPKVVAAILGGRDRRFRRAFFRLVRWGERHGIAFSTALGPKEYASMVADRVPGLGGALTEIASLYERHLFGRPTLTPAEMSDYFNRIEEVVHSDAG